jgi:hypothetical protein
MSEENAAVESEIESSEVESSDAVVSQCSQSEQDEAKAMGWIPAERFKPDEGKKFVDAKEFMERNPLYKKMKRMEDSLGKVSDHYEKVMENQKKALQREYEAEITRLKQAKADALDRGDSAAVVDLDDKIADARANKVVADEAQPKNPEFDEWHEQNEWYLKDKVLTAEANDMFEKLKKLGGFESATEMYNTISSELKERFPAKFKNPAREAPSPVEGGRMIGKTADTRLTPEEKAVMKDWEERGIFDKAKDPKAARQKYIQQVIDLRS